jgi:hypothetical protein
MHNTETVAGEGESITPNLYGKCYVILSILYMNTWNKLTTTRLRLRAGTALGARSA